MGLSELVGGPCVSNGIILKEGGGWEAKQLDFMAGSFLSCPFKKKSCYGLVHHKHL